MSKIGKHLIFSIMLSSALSFSPFAFADQSADAARLEAIQLLSERDNQAALKQLKDFYSSLPAEVDYQLRIDTLFELAHAYGDAGDTAQSDASFAQIKELAQRKNDVETLAVLSITEAYNLRDSGKAQAALAKLDEIARVLKTTKRVEYAIRLEIAYTGLYLSASKFDQALAHNLAALRLTDQLTQHRTLSKIRRLDSLASMYFTMQNPEKSLVVVSEALALTSQVNSPRISANLRQTQAMALAELKRYPEALVAYERSLQSSKDANLPRLEALTLSNIADLYLRTHNFVKAEQVARQALKKATDINDELAIYNAKANIGFALGGQFKINQAMEYLNPVLAHSREMGDKADIEATVGEIGRMLERAKMYKEALEYTREQQKLSDEVFRADRAKTVATLQEQFDADQRQKQIELLARENQIKDADLKNGRLQQIITLLGATVTIFVGIFIYMLYRKVKQTNAKLEEVNQQLEFHSVRDPLTGLHNRRSFLELMKTRGDNIENDRRESDGSNPDCLMILDIDHFKHINDTWGHAAGDAVLVEVAKRLRSAVRDSDQTMRWGGEEFLIYSPRTRPTQLTPMVERVLRSIGSTPVVVGSHTIPVTVSAGYISLPFSGVSEQQCNWEKAMQFADMALYLGKVNGRNRAYGLISLLQPAEVVLPVLDQDFSSAIKNEMVEVVIVHGPKTETLK
jgi:diguanylate cyclase (GGDEF)-like protein